MKKTPHDFEIYTDPDLSIVYPKTPGAVTWMRDHAQCEPSFGDGFPIKNRHVFAALRALRFAGFSVETLTA